MQIPEEIGSKYRFIVLAGERVEQLQKGAKPRVESSEKLKFTEIAIQELSEGKINFTAKATGEEADGQNTEGEKALAGA